MADSLWQKWKRVPRWQRIAFWACFCVLLYTLVGFLAVPALTRAILPKKLSAALNRQVTLDKVAFNPYKLTLRLDGFQIMERDEEETMAGFDTVFADLESASLFKLALIFSEIRLEQPTIHIARLDQTTYSFSDLIPAEKAEQQNDASEKKGLLFSLNNITIIGGTFVFDDRPKKTIHRIEELSLAVPFISNLEYTLEEYVQPDFTAKINGAPIDLGGRSRPFASGRPSEFSFKLTEVNLVDYLAYLPVDLPLTLRSGVLGLEALVSLHLPPGEKPDFSLSGTLGLKNVDIVDRKGTSYVMFPQLNITLAPSKILAGTILLSAIDLQEPRIRLSRTKEGALLPVVLFTGNAQAALDKETKTPENAGTLDFVLEKLMISKAKIELTDESPAEPFAATLFPIDVSVDNFSLSPKDKKPAFRVTAISEAKEHVTANGTFVVNPFSLAATVKAANIPLPRYRPYYQNLLAATVESGTIEAGTSISVQSGKNGEPMAVQLQDLAILISAFAVSDPKEKQKPVTIERLQAEGGRIALPENRVRFSRISGQGGVDLVRDNDGAINLAALFKPPAAEPEPAAEGNKDVEESKSAPPWLVAVDQIELNPLQISFEDKTPARPARFSLDDLQLTIDGFSTEKGNQSALSFSAKLNKKGRVSLKGPLILDPLKTDLALRLQDVALADVQSYVAEHLNIVIADGRFSTSGDLAIAATDSKKPAVSFKGDLGIAKMAVNNALSGEPLVGWGAFDLDNISFDLEPLSVTVRQARLKDWSASVKIAPSGDLNLASLVKKDSSTPSASEKTPAKPKPEAERPKISIETVLLENGSLAFADHSITPAYRASLDMLGGKITGLTTDREKTANLDLSGRLDGQSPLAVHGAISPLTEKIYADVTVDFKNIEMSPFSPYTGKYIGFKTDKGKLKLNLHYLLDGKELTAENKVLLDQFTLGETVKSPDAVKLPLQLAMSLLKNRRGEIHLNIPVRGNLGDPKFSVAGVAFQVLFNLIAKAATSPFALLGALLPSGGDLQHVAFDPGSAALSETFIQNLDSLAKVLFERPGLRMDITGSVDYEADRAAMHEARFQGLLKQAKYQEISKKEQVSGTVDDVQISEEEFPEYLKEAYKNATFDKPKNFFGFEKSLPDPEMEQMLRDNIIIADDDLRLLALERAHTVRDHLVETGPVEPDRLFVVEPRILATDEDKARSLSEAKAEMAIR